MAFFKPRSLTWEDVEGGYGEELRNDIDAFVGEHCYEAKDYESDEELSCALSQLADDWESLFRMGFIDNKQIEATLSLIGGAFQVSDRRWEIREALSKSAKKDDLVDILTLVCCVLCQYLTLKGRVERAEAAP